MCNGGVSKRLVSFLSAAADLLTQYGEATLQRPLLLCALESEFYSDEGQGWCLISLRPEDHSSLCKHFVTVSLLCHFQILQFKALCDSSVTIISMGYIVKLCNTGIRTPNELFGFGLSRYLYFYWVIWPQYNCWVLLEIGMVLWCLIELRTKVNIVWSTCAARLRMICII